MLSGYNLSPLRAQAMTLGHDRFPQRRKLASRNHGTERAIKLEYCFWNYLRMLMLRAVWRSEQNHVPIIISRGSNRI